MKTEKRSVFWVWLVALSLVVQAAVFAGGEKEAAASSTGAAKTYHWKFGTVDPVDHVNVKGFEEMIKYLDQAMPGKWKFDIFPNSQLGDAMSMVESVQMGSLEMAGPASSIVANFVPEYGVWDMPFLFRDEAHVDKVMQGPIGERIGAAAEKANIKLVAWMEVGFRSLANNKRPVNSADDVSGLRLRVMANEIHQALFSALGADPVPMALSEAYVANQNGTIDGQDNPLANMIQLNVPDVCRYFAVTRHVYSPLPLILSMKAWKEMSPEEQKLFIDCGKRAAKWQFENNRIVQAKAEEQLKQMGKTVTHPPIPPFAAKMGSVYDKYPQFKDVVKEIQAVN
jgi:tripartite ATP-independent transporter DctP family solute receptor